MNRDPYAPWVTTYIIKRPFVKQISADFDAAFLSKSPNVLSAITVIPLTVNKIASSGGVSRRFRYSGRRYSRLSQ